MVRAVSRPIGDVKAELAPELVVECVQGDEAAWRRLHVEYYPVAIAFLRKLGVREADIEDAAQEVFLQTYRYLSRFRGSAQLKTWLYRLCITQARRTRRRRRISEALLNLLALGPQGALGTSAPFCERSARRRIELVLNQLSDNERTALVLYEMEGLPGKQVAEILGCNEATLWRRLHYARKNFLRAFEESRMEGPA
jgi:RNA polymerase sigma-70 factor (ECF subfamily)